MSKEKELYQKIIENYDERKYLAKQENIELLSEYAEQESIKIEWKDHYTVVLTNPKGDTFTFNPQKHEGLADFFMGFNQQEERP